MLSPQAQDLRVARALAQYHQYRFRLTTPTVNGRRVALVSVQSPEGQGYSVYGNRCNCGDFRNRCQDEEGRTIGACKHVAMATKFLAEQAPDAELEARRERARSRRDADFPDE